MLGGIFFWLGLVVSLGGFTKDARNKAKEQFFKVRLWDSDDLIEPGKELGSRRSAKVTDAFDDFQHHFKLESPMRRKSLKRRQPHPIILLLLL